MNHNIYQKTENREKKLKILVVIHGFPPNYMAGSEIYTFNKCTELSKKHEIFVFTRIEDEFRIPYKVSESVEDGIHIIRVNKPERDYTFRNKYQDFKLAEIFKKVIKKIKPDVVHINHLSHLTVLIVDIIKELNIPIIFTLHDFWMICVRGQLIKDDYSLCLGPSLENCAKCNRKYFDSEIQARQEVESWLATMSRINDKVDLFIAPSQFLKNLYVEYGISNDRIIYMDYGFDKNLLKDIKKIPSEKIRFGYLGRIIPVKGISQLIEAFNTVDHSKADLNIYGKPPGSIEYLKKRCENSAIHFIGGYDCRDISKVLSDIDVLVVPSLWFENSPLVIHEAFVARIPVITSNLGGMAELVTDKKNGLLFEPRNIDDLKEKINQFVKNPHLIKELSQYTEVRSIQEDVQEIEKIYYKLLNQREAKINAQ